MFLNLRPGQVWHVTLFGDIYTPEEARTTQYRHPADQLAIKAA
jgi:hypothetical protein